MVGILSVTIWIDLLVSFSSWILFLAEVYLGKRVYDATRRRLLLRQKIAQLRLMASSTGQRQRRIYASSSTAQQPSDRTPENLAFLLLFREQLPALPNTTWERLAMTSVVASVFVLAYGGVSVLLRPIVNRALLSVLPVCLPLAIIPFPYLLTMKPHATLLILAGTLASALLMLVLTGV